MNGCKILYILVIAVYNMKEISSTAMQICQTQMLTYPSTLELILNVDCLYDQNMDEKLTYVINLISTS